MMERSPAKVTIISDIRNHYGFPQMTLAAGHGYLRNAKKGTPEVKVGFCGINSFDVEAASRLGAVLAREGKNQVITMVADPGVANHGYVIEMENGPKIVVPGNPKGSAASQIIHEALSKGKKIQRIIKLDHSTQEALPDIAKYEHGWPTFPGLGLYSYVSGALAAGINANKFGKELTRSEIKHITEDELFKPEERLPTETEHIEQIESIRKNEFTLGSKSKLFVLLNFMPHDHVIPHPRIKVPEGYTPIYVNLPGKGTAQESVVSHAIVRHLRPQDVMAVAGEGTVRVTSFDNGPTVVEGNAEHGSRLYRLSNEKNKPFKSTADFTSSIEKVLEAKTSQTVETLPILFPAKRAFLPDPVVVKRGYVEGHVAIPGDTFGNVTTNIYENHLNRIGVRISKTNKVPLVLEIQGKDKGGNTIHHLFELDLTNGLVQTPEGHTLTSPAGGDAGAHTLYTFMGHAAGAIKDSIAELRKHEDLQGRTIRIYRHDVAMPAIKNMRSNNSAFLNLGGQVLKKTQIVFHGALKAKE